MIVKNKIYPINKCVQSYWKAWMIVLCVLLSSMSLISSSVESLPSQKLFSNTSLIQTCSNSSYANITRVYAPNGSIVLKGQLAMTKLGDDYNYYYIPTSPGTYLVYGNCDENKIYTTWQYDFIVTQNGEQINTGKGIIYLLFMIGAFAIFGLLFYFAIKIPYKNFSDDNGNVISINNMKYLKVIMIALTYIAGLFLVGLLRGITANYIYEIGAYKFFYWIYSIMISALYPIIVCTLLALIINFIADKKLEKQLERFNFNSR